MSTNRFPEQPDTCLHPTASWQPHRKYGDFEAEITCMLCGQVMITPLQPGFMAQLVQWFKELDRRRHSEKVAA